MIRAPLFFNQASFDDDLFDPLSHGEKLHEYLSFDPEKLIFETFGSKSLKFEIIFGLNGWLKIASRTRYNYWNLLGDVGGFHDGLILMSSLFMTAYASLAFQKDYLNGYITENSSDDKISTFEQCKSYKTMMGAI